MQAINDVFGAQVVGLFRFVDLCARVEVCMLPDLMS
jgi:hypothetical protein